MGWITQQHPACCLSWGEQKRPPYPSSWFGPRLLCTRRNLWGWTLGLCFPPQPLELGKKPQKQHPVSALAVSGLQSQRDLPWGINSKSYEICHGAAAGGAVVPSTSERDAPYLHQRSRSSVAPCYPWARLLGAEGQVCSQLGMSSTSACGELVRLTAGMQRAWGRTPSSRPTHS